MKLRITLIAEVEVTADQLSEYEASTIEEAAKNQAQWFTEGIADPIEFLTCAAPEYTVSLIPIQDPS